MYIFLLACKFAVLRNCNTDVCLIITAVTSMVLCVYRFFSNDYDKLLDEAHKFARLPVNYALLLKVAISFSPSISLPNLFNS